MGKSFEQKDIDLLIEHNDKLHPIEFKKTSSPSINASKSFNSITKLALAKGEGAIICLKQKDVTLSKDVFAIPVGYL